MLHLNGGNYLYCCNTNAIINRQFEEIYLKYSDGRKIEFKEVKVGKEIILSKIKNLKQAIFETTHFCNMRCKYCSYSGEYYLNRKSSAVSLELQTGKKALDYIYQFIKNRKKKEFIIGFYGGEPLLKFEIIKEIVKYAKKKFKNWKLNFTITTNGTILNDEIIKYLITNSFRVFISVDGPQTNHDSKRIFQDGKGTYQIVVGNLKKIRKINHEYYNNNITFSVTFSNDLSIWEVYLFFTQNELVKKNKMVFGNVNPIDTSYYSKYPYDKEKSKREFNIIYEKLKDKLRKKQELFNIENVFFDSIKRLNDSLNTRKFSLMMASCFFDSRLYIDVYGRFHICEKINDKFSFGDVEHGFDFDVMEKIVRDFTSMIQKNCMDCDLKFLCTRCFIHFAKDGEFRIDPAFCENSKKIFLRLEKLIQLKIGGLIK